MTETREPYAVDAFESYQLPTRPGEPPGVVPYAPLTLEAARAQLEGQRGAVAQVLGELTAARAENERLRATEQRNAAAWLTEFAAIVKPEADARRVLLLAAETIRDMGDWGDYEMHPETVPELERQIRADERERVSDDLDRLADGPCTCTPEQESGQDATTCPRCQAATELNDLTEQRRLILADFRNRGLL